MSISKHIVLILFSLVTVYGFTQQNGNYSKSKTYFSKRTAPKNVSAKELVSKLSYAEKIFKDSTSQAIQIVQNTIDLAEKQKEPLIEALAIKTLGFFNTLLGNHKEALSYYDKCIPQLIKENSSAGLKSAYKHASTSAKALNKFQLSNTYLLQAEKIIRKEKNNSELLDNLLIQADNYYLQNQLDQADRLYNECISIAKTIKEEDKELKAEIGLTQVYNAKQEYEKSRKQLQASKKKADKIDNIDLTNSYYNSLSEVSKNAPSSSNEYAVIQQEVITYNNSNGNYDMATQSSVNLSKSLLQQNRTKEALEVLEGNTEIATKSNDLAVKKEYYKVLGDIYREEGEKDKAEKLQKEYDAILDSFALAQNNRQIILEAKNNLLDNAQNKVLLLEKERELRDKEIELLKKDQDLKDSTIKRQKIISWVLGIGLLAIGVLLFFIYKNNREKKISNQLLVLKSLRNQMNPHFIFNSLNSVNSFIAQQDERSANKYLASFSKLMREVLEYSQEDFIPLSKEIEILKIYLDLEHFRFKDTFDFEFIIDPSINREDYLIPPMLIQPFVENAIWHGLRYKKDKGKLTVVFKQMTDHILITIEDDGIGREQSKALKTSNQKKMKSTGLKNVENRLAIIKNVFKRKLIVDIQDIKTNQATGTKVFIKLF